MTSIARIYIDELRHGLDGTVVPVFAPDTRLEVGSIGSFEDDQFIPRGHLRERGAEIPAAPGPTTPTWSFRSQGKVELSPAIELGLPDGTKAFAAKLSFSGGRGVVASFAEVVEMTAVDADDVDRAIWELYLAGRLRPDRLVVWSLRRAARGTVVVSGERGASVKLTAPVLSTLTLDGLSAGVSFGNSKGIGYLLSGAEVTAWVRLKRITPAGRTPVEDIRRFDVDVQERLRRRTIQDVMLDDLVAPASE
jgi:hypothetical protein